ncbi:MAG: MBL fold metallo-hydrolase [Planctomycetes bacterium]|nr:MBL fold metallo-hydrolase [Planctomycetota bacterium]
MSTQAGTITIVFRGVRGSYCVPGPSTLVYGGNTTSQEIRVGGRLLVFDAGTGIISLGQEMAAAGGAHTFALFFSHNHHDHTTGILYFKPAYSPQSSVYIYGPDGDPGTVIDALEYLSAPAAHPVQFHKMGMKYTCDILNNTNMVRWRPEDDAPATVPADTPVRPEDVVVRVLKSQRHPVNGVLNFRLEYRGKSYVYATDVEGDEENGDAELAHFAAGADLLAHDGQYTSEEYAQLRRGWGHSTAAMAVKTALLAKVKQLAIIHHEPTYDDAKLAVMEQETKSLFQNSFYAKEGQVVVI